MADKYQNKYRIQSHRMPGWDYSKEGMYFITLVTQNRECHLGKIENQEILLSDWGNIVNDQWLKSFEIRKELFCDEYIIMPNHLHAIIIIDKPINNLPLLDGTDGTDGSDGSDGTDGSRGSRGSRVETHGRASLRCRSSQRDDRSSQRDDRASQRDGRASQRDDRASERDDRASQRDNHSSEQPEPNNPNFYRKPQSVSSFIAGFKSAVNSKIDDYIDEHQLNIPKYNRNNHFFQPNYHDRIIRNDVEYQRIKQYIINNPKHWDDDTFNN